MRDNWGEAYFYSFKKYGHADKEYSLSLNVRENWDISGVGVGVGSCVAGRERRRPNDRQLAQ